MPPDPLTEMCCHFTMRVHGPLPVFPCSPRFSCFVPVFPLENPPIPPKPLGDPHPLVSLAAVVRDAPKGRSVRDAALGTQR